MSGGISRSADLPVVTKKRLDYAARARRDIEAIEAYYLKKASEAVADRAVDAILSQAEKIAALDLKFRPGIRAGTRECVMTRFPIRWSTGLGRGSSKLSGCCISDPNISTD